ncbi:MAG: UDP-glucose/GDP-mannose dehydrogenase dimerization [Parcubacteria group bacterium Gr01-1014_56]|nr:MAG: UDP-glucose/GDP-mannose dehydrogenase dimerization [Parcubacteria group bacterium Gr01-1014_56]
MGARVERLTHMKIGFVGQGFIGKNYADDFERRGFAAVRYSLEEPYIANREKIYDCDFVFIAVPTPTTPTGFDDSMLRAVLPLVGAGKVAVIKSTTLPGTVKKLQKEFPDRVILHSPEFLAEKTAAYDAAHPTRNIVGLPDDSEIYHTHAQILISILPKAPYEMVADSDETELIKYAGNAFLYMKIIFANLMYDIGKGLKVDYEIVQQALSADPRIGPSHLRVIDTSGHKDAQAGRGAGGHCLIKDFGALRMLYESVLPEDKEGLAVLRSLEDKNRELLIQSKKDLDLLKEVYGPL